MTKTTTRTDRSWLRAVRQSIRRALLDIEFEREGDPFLTLRANLHPDIPDTDLAHEIKSLTASVLAQDVGHLKIPVVRISTMKRLREVKHLIGESLIMVDNPEG